MGYRLSEAVSSPQRRVLSTFPRRLVSGDVVNEKDVGDDDRESYPTSLEGIPHFELRERRRLLFEAWIQIGLPYKLALS